MLKARLNKSIDIEICNNWSDLTIKQCETLYTIADRFPSNVKRLYTLLLDKQTDKVKAEIAEIESNLTEEQKIKTLPTLYGELMLLLTDIDKSVVDKLYPQQRTNFYDKYLMNFVLGVLVFPVDFKVKQIESFELDDTMYLLPKTRKFNIGQHEIVEPMSNVSILEFTEVADLILASKSLEGGKIAALSNVCAIVCRPANESYDENVAIQMASYFRDNLTMDIAWEVFFCLIEHFSTLKKRSEISLNLTELKKEMTVSLKNLVGMVKS